MAILIEHNDPIDVPKEVALCPYCNGSLSVQVMGCEMINGEWVADDVMTECLKAPDIDSPYFEEYEREHSWMPYIYQLPVDLKVKDWLVKNYRFAD